MLLYLKVILLAGGIALFQLAVGCQQEGDSTETVKTSDITSVSSSSTCESVSTANLQAEGCPIESTNQEEEKVNVEEESVFTGPTCSDLSIPSWDKTVQALSTRLCERCHNDSFAWNGVKLHTYDNFVLNAETSEERIRTENFSFELRVIDKLNFLDWFEAGMPKTEQDCAPISS